MLNYFSIKEIIAKHLLGRSLRGKINICIKGIFVTKYGNQCAEIVVHKHIIHQNMFFYC